MNDTIDGEYREVGSAVAVRPSSPPAQQWTPRFVVTVDDAVAMVNEKREFMRRVMRKETHYGVIPGTDKPALWKPGAELLLSSMGLHPELSNESDPVLDVDGRDHSGEPFIFYQRVCRVFRRDGATGERFLVAQAGGSCSSWETKYRYRNAERICPTCGKNAIIKGKQEYGGGWVCFKKKEGCGAKFQDADTRITGQETGKVANPDVAELMNTVLKMADKRALIAATLLATGCSDIFTQDMESQTNEPPPEWEPPSEPAAAAKPANGAPAGRTLGQSWADLFSRWYAAAERTDDGPTASALFDAAIKPLGIAGARAWVEALERGPEPQAQEHAPPPETRATVTERPGTGFAKGVAVREKGVPTVAPDDAAKSVAPADAATSGDLFHASQAIGRMRGRGNPAPRWTANEAQKGYVFALHAELGHDDDARHALYERLCGVRSFNDLDAAMYQKIANYLSAEVDKRGTP
jgi:hypothetical protein